MKGFTLIEVMVVTGIILALFGLTTLNLGRIPSDTSQNSIYNILIADLRSQQIKAMAGNSDYGIEFDGSGYSLIPQNFTIELDPGLSINNITFPGATITFSARSGDTVNGSFDLENSQTGEVRTVNINKYGATY